MAFDQVILKKIIQREKNESLNEESFKFVLEVQTLLKITRKDLGHVLGIPPEFISRLRRCERSGMYLLKARSQREAFKNLHEDTVAAILLKTFKTSQKPQTVNSLH